MRLIFHHPYFLPWLGYFSKLEYADALVILDNVVVRHDGLNHIKRTRLLDTNDALYWFGVPIPRNFGALCCDINLRIDHGYLSNLCKTLQQSYKKARSFREEYPFIENILTNELKKHQTLVDADVALFKCLRSHCGLAEKPILYSSSFPEVTDRTDRIISISKQLKATEILIGDGKMEKVHDIPGIKSAGIKVFIQKFSQNHPRYEQMHVGHSVRHKQGIFWEECISFKPGLSIVDALLNVGHHEIYSLLHAVQPIQI